MWNGENTPKYKIYQLIDSESSTVKESKKVECFEKKSYKNTMPFYLLEHGYTSK